MLGLMQQRPLLISSLLDYSERYHAGTEIVSRSVEGPLHRSNWGAIAARARRVANALHRLGVVHSDRIATLAWNHNRHLEIYFGVTCSGAILHTVNPRLFPEQVRFIIDDAEASYVFFDVTFAALVEQLAPQLRNVRGYVALCAREALPSIDVPNLLCYEDLLAAETDDYAWPAFDENTASALCYTSGTTGNPKGVLQSHRSAVLHSFSLMAADTMAISVRESLLLCAPLFHVNCWGIPFAAAGTGAKLVLPGMKLDGASLFELIRDEGITFCGAVPTVWLNLFAWMEQNLTTTDQRGLKLKRVLSGGSAVPRVVIEKAHAYFGATMLHAWGMTEMSPLGTCGSLLARHVDLDLEQRMPVHLMQGRTIYGAEVRIVDDEGHEPPLHRRDTGARAVGAVELLQGRRRQGGGRRRLVPHRRRRTHGCRRVHHHYRPRQGRDQVGRRVDQLDRDREPGGEPPGGAGGRGDRHTPCALAGTPAIAGASQAGHGRDQGGAAGVPVGQDRQVVAAR
jgi:fatty-acyl-CoA synthase